VVRWFGVEYALPGVRVVLWLAALVILVAAVLAARSIKVRIREMLTPAQFVARVHGKENP
jgi:hypothetical protein